MNPFRRLYEELRQRNPIMYGQEYVQRQLYGGESSEEARANVINAIEAEQGWTRTDEGQFFLTTLLGSLGIPVPKGLWNNYNKFWDEQILGEDEREFAKSLFVYIYAFGLIASGIFIYKRI